MDGVPQVQPAGRGEHRSVTSHAGGGYTVELVNPQPDCLNQTDRIPDSHQVARSVPREFGDRYRERRQHFGSRLTHRQAADAVPVKTELDGPPGALDPKHRIDTSLDDSEQCLILGPGFEAGM